MFTTPAAANADKTSSQLITQDDTHKGSDSKNSEKRNKYVLRKSRVPDTVFIPSMGRLAQWCPYIGSMSPAARFYAAGRLCLMSVFAGIQNHSKFAALSEKSEQRRT